MKFRYSSEVDILMVYVSDEPPWCGEDNEGVIVHYSKDGSPLALEILYASRFVMLANASLVTGQEIANPNASGVPYTKERDVPIRPVPRGDADLRFNYLADSDTLMVRFGDGASDFSRRNHDMTVYYDGNEVPTGLEITNARQFVLASVKSALLHEEVSVA